MTISDVADRLDVDALPERERNALFAGIAHDPTSHDVYRFFVAVAERNAPRH